MRESLYDNKKILESVYKSIRSHAAKWHARTAVNRRCHVFED